MIVRWLAVAALFGWASAAQAADWWWIGGVGQAPNRSLTYVDRQSIRRIDGGAVEVWLLDIGEGPRLDTGQQYQADHWAFKCRQRTLSVLGTIALDPSWRRLPLPEVAPTAYAPLVPGSIAEMVMNVACGHASGRELHVDQPAQHALAYFHNGAAQPAAPAGGPDRASEWWFVAAETNIGALAYVYRPLNQPTQDGRIAEVYLLELYGTPLANGATREVAGYRIDCLNRHYERTALSAMDEEGHRLPSSETAPPTGTIPPGTVADRVYAVACGQLTGQEIRIDDPFAHAGAYFHRQFAIVGNGLPGGAGAGAPDGGGPAEPSGVSVGTAFFVGPEGYALTAYHVIDGADRIACRTGDGAVHAAVPARLNQANDLALLRVDFRPTRYLGLAPRGSLRPGERVFTIGYGAPSYLGINEPRFTEGAVSALSGLAANDAEVQITVPIQPGNSGGPLVNEAGQVVGIITSTAATEEFQQEVGATPQSINWAVKSDYAAPLLPRLPPARPMTRAQAIALTHDAVCFVIALHAGDEAGTAAPRN